MACYENTYSGSRSSLVLGVKILLWSLSKSCCGLCQNPVVVLASEKFPSSQTCTILSSTALGLGCGLFPGLSQNYHCDVTPLPMSAGMLVCNQHWHRTPA